jgi:hypothetical protein
MVTDGTVRFNEIGERFDCPRQEMREGPNARSDKARNIIFRRLIAIAVRHFQSAIIECHRLVVACPTFSRCHHRKQCFRQLVTNLIKAFSI